MSTIQMSPGAMVIAGSHHGGLDRLSTGLGQVGRLAASAVEALEAWHAMRVDAHNDAMRVELAAHDPRVLADLRAAYARAGA